MLSAASPDIQCRFPDFSRRTMLWVRCPRERMVTMSSLAMSSNATSTGL
ncbi:MAG: hypothetical protein M5U33_06215 [Pseudorhodoplanes sp.]|nr:hypothetical protein [Pseudorhodoplanes sp.]